MALSLLQPLEEILEEFKEWKMNKTTVRDNFNEGKHGSDTHERTTLVWLSAIPADSETKRN